jgi:methyltransferase (TIGR00027 family)
MHDDMKFVEIQRSELARSSALVRSLAALDGREEIRGNDSLADIFIADDRKNSLNDPVVREWLVKNYLPHGVYAYTIARTAYFDHIVAQGLRDSVPQIVILGAGYDSRPYRFADLMGDTRIFELDDVNILERKQKLLQQADIPVPKNLAYAPLSYDPGQLSANLAAAGFDAEKQTLFIWEGATYYLTADEVDRTIRFIGANSPAGSTICFDYNTTSRERSGESPGNELAESMGTPSANVPEQFVIEEGKAGTYLAERDFLIIEHLDAEEMERRFLTLSDGSAAEQVPARHHLVYASLSK